MPTPEPLARMRRFLVLAGQVSTDQWEHMSNASVTDPVYARDVGGALALARRHRSSAAVNSGVTAAIGDFIGSEAFSGRVIADVLWQGYCVGLLESAGVGITRLGKCPPETIEVFLRPFVQIAHLDLSGILPDDVWQVVRSGPAMTWDGM